MPSNIVSTNLGKRASTPSQRASKPFQRRRSIKAKPVTSRAGIARIAKQVFNRNVEWKIHDVTYAPTAVDTAGATQCLSLVTQGDTDLTRDGDALRASSLNLRVTVASGMTSVQVTKQAVRLVVVQWQGDSANDPPAVTDVLGDAFSQLNHNYAPQYRVLADELFLTDSYHATQGMNMKLKIPHQSLQYRAGSTSHPQGIWLFMMSDIAAATQNPTLRFTSRLNFSDA